MSISPEELRDGIAKDLGIPKWNGEDERHWTGRCLYSAVGRHALHLLWDDERADLSGGETTSDSVPPTGDTGSGIGSISLFHFWRGLDRILIPFARLFPETFDGHLVAPAMDAHLQSADAILSEERNRAATRQEELLDSDWGQMPSDASGKANRSNLDRWKKWIFSIYLETGFLRHKPMRIGPVTDRCAKLGKINFLRGSHIDAMGLRMSGLAQYSKWGTKTDTSFSDLHLLPERRTLENVGPNDSHVRQTVQALVPGKLEPIRFCKNPSGEDAVVRLSVPFPLPREEKTFILLCSWPERNVDFPNMKRRSLPFEVFSGVRSELERLGYRFSETDESML